MSYAGQASETAPTQSILSETASINNRLMEINTRISKIADSLHGAQLQTVAGNDKANAPVPNSVRRNIDTAFSLLSNCETELSRVENRL